MWFPVSGEYVLIGMVAISSKAYEQHGALVRSIVSRK